MILCLTCNRLWPRGTVYCGHCGKTLGSRLCPELHPNRLNAKVCTTCGTRKLTQGSPRLSLRPASWLLVGLLAYGAWGLVVLPLASAAWSQVMALLWLIVTPVITLTFWSFVLSIFVGDKGRASILGLWSRVFDIVFKSVGTIFNLVFSLMRKPKKRE